MNYCSLTKRSNIQRLPKNQLSMSSRSRYLFWLRANQYPTILPQVLSYTTSCSSQDDSLHCCDDDSTIMIIYRSNHCTDDYHENTCINYPNGTNTTNHKNHYSSESSSNPPIIVMFTFALSVMLSFLLGSTVFRHYYENEMMMFNTKLYPLRNCQHRHRRHTSSSSCHCSSSMTSSNNHSPGRRDKRIAMKTGYNYIESSLCDMYVVPHHPMF
jgi:hypothetical protein